MGIRSVARKSQQINPGIIVGNKSTAHNTTSSMSQIKKITRAVIPAAGYGTRMLPATKALPKEMLPVAGKPLIQYAIEEAAASGIDTVILVIRARPSLIESYLAFDSSLDKFLRDHGQEDLAAKIDCLRSMVRVEYVQQPEPRGLAHAICSARPLLGDEPFAVLLPDVIMVAAEPVTRQLIRVRETQGGSAIAVREVELADVCRHGIAAVERHSARSSHPLRITGLVEKPEIKDAPSRIGIFGRYVLEPSVWKSIGQTPTDAQGEVQLTDALNILSGQQVLCGVLFDGNHYDAGDRLGYLKANIELSLLDPALRQPTLEYLERLQALSSA
jgi:UTP--glucose-1-phosphate uridylyltransferase